MQGLHRYPVKSMAGEALSEATVAPGSGVAGDRAHAVLDVETGKVASAKHPKRWGSLLACRARLVDPADARGPVTIDLPGGAARSDHDDFDDRLSAAFGRSARLIAAPPALATYAQVKPGSERVGSTPLAIGSGSGTFFDVAPIHLVTTASLERLAALRPASSFAVGRFRPNLVIETPDAGFVEDDWVGRIVAIGDHMRLCITDPCPRCVMVTLAHDGITADPGALRAAAEHHLRFFPLLARKVASVGVYASVVRGGVVRVGDPVRLEQPAPLRRAAAFARAIGRAVWRR